MVKDLEWKIEKRAWGDTLYSSVTELGRITILDRLTGYGWRDIETGYRDQENRFWLAAGDFDIREYPELTIQKAIEVIKFNSNICKGEKPKC